MHDGVSDDRFAGTYFSGIFLKCAIKVKVISQHKQHEFIARYF